MKWHIRKAFTTPTFCGKPAGLRWSYVWEVPRAATGPGTHYCKLCFKELLVRRQYSVTEGR